MEAIVRAIVNTGSFESALQSLEDYRQAPAKVRYAFKHYQIAQLELLAIFEPNWTKAMFYTKLYRMMKRYLFLGYVLAKISTFDLYIPRRHFLLRKRLKKDGFTYDPTLKCWHFYAN